jgi:hypothetical protein
MQFGPHHTFDCHREHVADAVIAELGEQECPLCSHVYRLEEHN